MMTQNYDQYTSTDQEVWQTLFDRQTHQLPGLASTAFINGVSDIGFKRDEIPRFSEINKVLKEKTGWGIYAVPGLIPNRDFFEALKHRLFPATTWFRKPDQLDYLEEPDMFHDVFGHVPLLTNQPFCNYLTGLSKIALDHIDNDDAIELISRLYWYTVEFGLIKEPSGLKIYGSGILSSAGESPFSLSDKPKRVEFSVDDILRTPYIKDRFQEKYWVIQSYDDLYSSVPEIREKIEALLKTGVRF